MSDSIQFPNDPFMTSATSMDPQTPEFQGRLNPNLAFLSSHRPVIVRGVIGTATDAVYTIQMAGHHGIDIDGNVIYHDAGNAPGFVPPGHLLRRAITPQMSYQVGDVVEAYELYTLANPEVMPDDNTGQLKYFIIGKYNAWNHSPGQFLEPPTPLV